MDEYRMSGRIRERVDLKIYQQKKTGGWFFPKTLPDVQHVKRGQGNF